MWNRPRRLSAKKAFPSLVHLSIESLEDRAVPAAFTPGDLAVYRVGDGSAALGLPAAAVFIDEYTPSGTLVQSIAMPTTDNGANQTLTASGSAISEGLLTLSTDGQYLLLTGYDAAVGASVATTTSASVNRVVGRVDGSGKIDTTTALPSFFSGSNIRGAASTNGTDIWVSGNASSGASGVGYTVLGSTTATQLSTTVTNIRGVEIFGGQLYVSDSSGTTVRLGSVGTGLPTVSGKTITNLPGFPTTGSPYAFFFADLSSSVAGLDTLYVADDGATGSGAGIQKYSLVGGSWLLNTTITASTVRGLTGVVNGKTVTLYSTNGSSLSTFTDATGYEGSPSGSVTDIATAATNTAFRGVAFVPVAVNHAPSISGANNFTTIDEDDTANSGTLVSDLVSGKVSDPDSGALAGIAVTATDTSHGSWQYTTDGGNHWNAVGTVDAAHSLLLAADSNTRLRFLPNADFNGTVSNAVTFRAWDQASGAAGSKVDTSTNGGNTAFSSATAAASITVNPVNDAPTLSGANNFTTIDEDDTTNSGTKVADLISGHVSDVDAGALTGIAVTDTATGSGSWEFTTDGGSHWTAVGSVSDSSALLLSAGASTRLRFVPSANFNGTVSNAVSFRAWDQTRGTAGDKVSTAGNGGATAFSSVTACSSITVNPVNDAPALSGAIDFSAIDEDDTTNNGTKVSDLVDGQVTDADSAAASGIAVTATASSSGTWQYTTDGSTWNDVGSVSDSGALLLKADSNTRLRFVPSVNFNGTVSNGITFRAWDQTSGSAGDKVDTSVNAGTTAFSSATASSSITVNAVNDAPVLSGSNDLHSVAEDDTANAGTLVSDIVNGRVSDADTGALQGIAITATDETNGTWQYSTDGGAHWNSIGSIGVGRGLLLAADSDTRIRFAPTANFNGTVSSGVTFRAWDQSDSGTPGDVADVSTNGGSSPFSSVTASAGITVNAVNDAPTLNGTNDFTAIDEDDTANTGTLVSDLIGGQTSDPDSGANSGIAVTATHTSSGTWEYTTDGNTWNDVGAVSDNSALLLAADADTRLRFVPNANFNGTVTNGVTFRAWDQTSGNAGDKVDASSNGGASAFSTVAAGASIAVKPVNDAPVLGGANDFNSIDEDDTTNAGTKVSDLINGQVTDVDYGAASGIAVTATDTSSGTWQYTIDGSTWNDVGSVSDSAALLLAADVNTRIRFVPGANFNGTVTNGVTFRAWDQTSGLAGDKVDASPNGSTTAFSSATAAASITVNAVNDAPVLSGVNDFTAIDEDDTASAGTLVSDLISGQVTDPDSGALPGIAVTATDSSNGTWEFTTDGSDWKSVGTVADSGALLLAADSNTRLRFVPNPDFNGMVVSGVTFRAWDQTTGTAGTKVDASTNGGAGAFSSATASAAIMVNAVNDEPSVTLLSSSLTVNQDSGKFTQAGFAAFSPGGGADEASQTPTYALTNTNNALFSSQPAIDATGKLTFTPAPGASGTASVTVNVADSGPGAPPNDNTGAPKQFTITVNAVVIVPPVAAQPVSVAASASRPQYIAIGSDAGVPSRVQILSATTGAVLADFSPFGSYSGGVNVAVGDLNGDGTDDIVIASAGTVGMLEMIDGRTGATVGPFTPFGNFAAGLEIAVGDIDGDDRADLLVGMQSSGSSVIAFTSGSGIIGPVSLFPGTNGVRIALGDVNGDGRDDIVIGAGSGGTGQILVFDGVTKNLIGSFASRPGFPGEVNLAIGDLDGDGKGEVLTATAAMFGTEVDVFTPQGAPVKTIAAPTVGASAGFARNTPVAPTNQSARIAAVDLTGDHIADILLGSTPGNHGSRLMILDGATGAILLNEAAFDPLFDFGVSLGVK